MKIVLCFVCFLLFANTRNCRGQYCSNDNRFTQTPTFSANQIQIDSMPFANVIDWQGANQTLKLDVYYPKNSAETISKRPLIMMIFGGGFVSGNRSQVSEYCLDFAERGFVAVAIDYRLGHEVAPCTDTLSWEKAVYRVHQDAHAAMRFMVAHAATYKIDTAWLFAGGYSAGAGTALALFWKTHLL